MNTKTATGTSIQSLPTFSSCLFLTTRKIGKRGIACLTQSRELRLTGEILNGKLHFLCSGGTIRKIGNGLI